MHCGMSEVHSLALKDIYNEINQNIDKNRKHGLVDGSFLWYEILDSKTKMRMFSKTNEKY